MEELGDQRFPGVKSVPYGRIGVDCCESSETSQIFCKIPPNNCSCDAKNWIITLDEITETHGIQSVHWHAVPILGQAFKKHLFWHPQINGTLKCVPPQGKTCKAKRNELNMFNLFQVNTHRWNH